MPFLHSFHVLARYSVQSCWWPGNVILVGELAEARVQVETAGARRLGFYPGVQFITFVELGIECISANEARGQALAFR